MVFDFEDLIDLYATHPVYWIKEIPDEEAERDYSQGGKIVKPKPEVIELGKSVITGLSEDDLKYGWGGTHYEEARKLYTFTQIPKGQKVEYKGKKYTVGRSKDYSDFTVEQEPLDYKDGLWIYELMRSDKE